MLYDTLQHRAQYKGLPERILRALDYLAETDFSALPDGRYELDGERLFANVCSYETKPVNDTPESHEKYMDIQYVFEGKEQIGVGPLEEMGDVVEARPEGDIWFYHGPVDEITLAGDKFAVLFPGDAHAPCIAVDGAPVPCRKCVVKVRVG